MNVLPNLIAKNKYKSDWCVIYRYHVWPKGHAPTNFAKWRTATTPYKVRGTYLSKHWMKSGLFFVLIHDYTLCFTGSP